MCSKLLNIPVVKGVGKKKAAEVATTIVYRRAGQGQFYTVWYFAIPVEIDNAVQRRAVAADLAGNGSD
jgi:hypothetical protein